MPLKITLKREITLSDQWVDEAAWEEVYAGNLPALVELFQDDPSALIEDCGGLGGMIEAAEWVDRAAERSEMTEADRYSKHFPYG